MECIVNFQVIYKNEEPKSLRGLLLLNEKTLPGPELLIPMFKRIGYDVVTENPEEMTFRPVNPNGDFIRIRVTELDTGEEVYKEDMNLRKILENLL
ncbi:hypothetical protein M3231_17505 [Neobacillus mesonae]|nr:hypothetical protein [Neobacillus mesonae]